MAWRVRRAETTRLDMHPFVRWVGGKWKNINLFSRYLPSDVNDRVYVEPFLGSGAMLFFKQPDHAVVSDSNPHLINAYQAIKTDLDGFLGELANWTSEDSDTTFSMARTRFNSFKDDEELFDQAMNDYKKIDTGQAAIFVYLIGRCFNGLYRENSKGEFNVSYARDLKGIKDLNDTKNFTAISRFFNEKDITISCSDYKNIKWRVDDKRGTTGRKCFYFLDPVYYPAKPSGFTKYNKSGWDETEFSLLKVFVKKINEAGDKFMLCNHDVPKIREIFKDYRIEKHVVPRCVSCDTKHRDPVTEVVIMNYRNASLSDYIGPPETKGSNALPADP